LEDLLKYIEDNGGKNQKSQPKNGIVTNNSSSSSNHQANDHLLSAEEREKKKKMAAKNKEKVNKLKKSNSMDELSSTGRHQQATTTTNTTTSSSSTSTSSAAANKIVQDVTLRSKSSNIASGAKKIDKTEKSQNKRNERRSWGTEGLWTETTNSSSSASDTSKDNQDEIQDIDSSSSSASSNGGVIAVQQPTDAVITSAVSVTNSNLFTESIGTSTSETAEFHVVTNKRKVKRKLTGDLNSKSTATNNLQSYAAMKRDERRAKNYSDKDVAVKNPRNAKQLNHDTKQTAKKSRRKSTSSMPSDVEGDYSDGGDSVQSLPIETTSSMLMSTSTAITTDGGGSGKAKKAHNSNNQQQQQQQQHQSKPATFSYADIAKTNANRSSGGTNSVATSTDKWPSVSASSYSSSHQINTNNDSFAITNSNESPLSSSSSSASSSNTHSKPQKLSTAPNMSSFPELVENNNNKNKQLSMISSENTSNGETIHVIDKPLNGVDIAKAFDTNNNSSSSSNVIINNNIVSNSSTEDWINNNNISQKITYSQSLLEKHNNNNYQLEIDSNGNNVKTDTIIVTAATTALAASAASFPQTTVATTTTNAAASTKATLIKSKSVDRGNFSMENYPALEKTKVTLSDVLSKPMETPSNNKVRQQKLQQLAAKAAATDIKDDVANAKRTKKDKSNALKKCATPNANPHFPQSTQISLNNNHRPAVIILNDCEKSSDVDGITFGFDIDEFLLLGHQQNGGDSVGITERVNLENNNNCDITNTNLSSKHNLINQPMMSGTAPPTQQQQQHHHHHHQQQQQPSTGTTDMYENFMLTQAGVSGDHSQANLYMMNINSQSSPKQQQLNQQSLNMLDQSSQSSNDLGYMSTSLITVSTSPATQKSSNFMPIDEPLRHDIAKFDDYSSLMLPKFISPQPAKFNQEELITFVTDGTYHLRNQPHTF